MLSFLEKVNEFHELNRPGGVNHALYLMVNVHNWLQTLVTTNLHFWIVYKWTFAPIKPHLPQLQCQPNHHLQSEILAIAAYNQETWIYFLQLLMVNVGITCIINIGSLVGGIVVDIINAGASFWNQTFWPPLSLQKNWKLKACYTVNVLFR